MNDMNTYLKIFAEIEWESLLALSLRVLAVLLLAYIFMRILRTALEKMENRLVQRGRVAGEAPSEVQKRAETLVKLLRQAAFVAVWMMAALVLLRELGFEIAPILAGAGILGLAVGFGAQNLVRDVISGFFMILENQIRVGDVALINGTGGLVERINFRTTVLRDLTGTVHVFPNGSISTLSNMTNTWSAYIFDLGVAYKEDPDMVIKILEEVGREMKSDEYFGPLMIDELEIFGVDKFADSAVIIKGRIRTKPIKQWEVGRQFLRRVKKAFDANNIEIPFPHRTIYFGEVSKPVDVKLMEHTARTRME
jgi:moderate conductance mechanosensitive channel